MRAGVVLGLYFDWVVLSSKPAANSWYLASYKSLLLPKNWAERRGRAAMAPT